MKFFWVIACLSIFFNYNQAFCLPLDSSLCGRLLKDKVGIVYHAVNVESGQHGGYRYFASKRQHGRALVKKKKLNASNEGGPEHYITVLGEKTAAFFGFKRLPNGDITIPDRTEINGAIRKVNMALEAMSNQDLLLISYYDAEPIRVPSRVYLQRFAESGQLPIAKRRHYFFHDISFHIGANLIPNTLILLVQSQLKALFKFENWVKTIHPEMFDEYYFDFIMDHVAQDIDFGNGNVIAYLSMLDLVEKQHKVVVGELVADTFKKFSSQGRSPKAFLEYKFGLEHLMRRGSKSDLKKAVVLQEFLNLEDQTNPLFDKGVAWFNGTYRWAWDFPEMQEQVLRKLNSIQQATSGL